MKKIIISINLIIVVCVLANAQPTITDENHLPAFGDWYQTSMLMEMTGVSPGPSGENQVWDFSGLTQGSLDPTTVTFIDPAGTPHIDQVPGCNLAIYDGESFYQYLKTTESGYEWSTLFINGNFALYTDPFTIFEFPFTYQSEFTDSYDYSIIVDEMNSHFYGTQLTTADGYGTLTTPIGIFNNVLRVVRKSENHSVTTVGGYSWSYSDTTYEYQWYAPALTYPLVSITTWPSSPDTSDVIYISNYGLTTDARNILHLNNVSIYPNPVRDKIILASDESWSKVSLMDLAGKTVRQWTNNSTGGHKIFFNVDNVNDGLYFLKIVNQSGEINTQKIIIQQ